MCLAYRLTPLFGEISPVLDIVLEEKQRLGTQVNDLDGIQRDGTGRNWLKRDEDRLELAPNGPQLASNRDETG